MLFVAATIASAFTPALASRHPLLLIILEARNRNLVLARHVDFVPFLLVATVRRMLTDPLFFLLGYYYGDNAVRWVEEKVPGYGPMVRFIERWFAKASYPVVFLFPGAIVCALAGSTGMTFRWFMVLNVAGTLFAVLVLRAFGDILGGPVDWLLDFFGRYTWQTTAVSVGLVALSVLLSRAEGRTISSVDDLEAELEGEPAEPSEDADGEGGLPPEDGRDTS